MQGACVSHYHTCNPPLVSFSLSASIATSMSFSTLRRASFCALIAAFLRVGEPSVCSGLRPQLADSDHAAMRVGESRPGASRTPFDGCASNETATAHNLLVDVKCHVGRFVCTVACALTC